MNDVFEKARALGEALLASEEYAAMRAAEDAASADSGVLEKMNAYVDKKSKVEEALANEAPDRALLAQYSGEMQALQAELNAMPLVAALNHARQGFTDMMKQVNQVIEFTLTGNMKEESAGCAGGDCSGCSGCQ